MRRWSAEQLGFALSGLAALALGAWLRVSDHARVLTAEGVLALSSEPTYHLHRALRAYEALPHVPVFDRLLAWPSGAYAPSSDGYALISALLARLVAGADDVQRAAAVIAIVPVLFALPCALFAALVARQLYAGARDRARTVLFAWWVAWLLPIGILTSQIGRTDPYGADAVGVIALCALALSRYPSEHFELRTRGQRLRFELLGALAITYALYVFGGALVYVAPVALVLMHASLCAPVVARGQRLAALLGSGALAFGLAALACAALYAPNLREHGILFSYAFPSLLQPVLIALAALALALTRLIAACVPLREGARPLAPRLALFAGTLLVLAGAAALHPGLRGQVSAAATEQLLRGEPWFARVAELQPLLRPSQLLRREGWSAVMQQLGWLGPLTPLVAVLAFRHARRVQPERARAFAFLALCVLALSLVQGRFTRALWPLFAVGTAGAASALVAQLEHALRAGRTRSASAVLVWAALLALLLRTEVVAARMLPSGAPPHAPQRASAFLARANPERPDGTRRGVLTSWNMGHALLWPARAGVTANGFGVRVGRRELERTQAALLGDEQAALAWMRERDLGWLMTGALDYADTRVGPARIAPFTKDKGLNTELLRQVPLAVAMLGGSAMPRANAKHFEQLAPRWASDAIPGKLPFFMPELWLFERVAGAVIQGRARPGTFVRADTELRVAGERVPYVAVTQTDASGAFALRVAVWNNQRDTRVESAPHWTLYAPQRPAQRIVIDERAVRQGSTFHAAAAIAPDRPSAPP